MVFYTEQGVSGFLAVENIVARCHCWIVARVSRNYVIIIGKCLKCPGVLCFIPPMPQYSPMPQDLIRLNTDLITNYVAGRFFLSIF